MTAQDFISFLYSQTTGIGLSTYSQLSSNSQTSAYTFFIDGSGLEELPIESIQPNKAFNDFSADPGWVQHIVPADLNFESPPVNADFRYIMTPESTIAMIYNYDMNNKCCCPYKATTYFKDYFEKFTDNIIIKENSEANDGHGFLQNLENGVKNYRCVLVFEFSHGGEDLITIGTNQSKIGEKLKMAGGMVFMMFDSCHSESMIDYNDINSEPYHIKDSYNPVSKDETGIVQNGGGEWDTRKSGNPLFKSASGEKEDNPADGIIDYLEKEFSKGERRLAARPPTIQETDKPIIMLWSSTDTHTYGWYFPQSSTDFAEAFKKVIGKYENQRFVNKDKTGLWPALREEGRCQWRSKESINRCRPCMRTFEPANNFNKFVYLFCSR